MTQSDTIKQGAGGSIDTEYYMERGRGLRSQTAHRLLSPKPKAPRSALSAVALVILALPLVFVR